MRKQYKIQLPKGKKVTMTNVDFENGVMTVNVELEKDDSNIWDKMIQEYGETICDKKEQKYEPKDGDFVYVKAGYEHIAIFKKEVGDDMYVYADWNMSLSVSKIIIDDSRPLCCIHNLIEIRPATEAEKKLLIDKLAEKDKKWNPKTKTIEDVRWRSVYETEYFYIDNYFNVIRARELNERVDELRNKSGNYFKTREAAEKAAEQIRETFQNSKSE